MMHGQQNIKFREHLSRLLHCEASRNGDSCLLKYGGLEICKYLSKFWKIVLPPSSVQRYHEYHEDAKKRPSNYRELSTN
jgi:hypothetical protein